MASVSYDELRASFVKTWLVQMTNSDAGSDSKATRKELPAQSSETGIATLLCEACVEELMKCSNAIQQHDDVGLEQKREWNDVQFKLRLFGGSFDGGKLETCLVDDDDTLRLLLSSLKSIAVTLSSGLLPFLKMAEAQIL
jgi:hypothetical protein